MLCECGQKMRLLGQQDLWSISLDEFHCETCQRSRRVIKAEGNPVVDFHVSPRMKPQTAKTAPQDRRYGVPLVSLDTLDLIESNALNAT